MHGINITAAKPTIIDGVCSPFVQRGQRASVSCMATGNPTPIIKWFLDGEPLTDRSHLKIGDYETPSGDVISFVNISSVSLLEGGDYLCIATNEVGEAEHTSRMNVYGKNIHKSSLYVNSFYKTKQN